MVILPGRWDSVARELKCESVHVWAGSLTVAAIDSVKNTGRSLCAYTVNDPERARFLVETGVDAVFSDRPDRVLAS